MSSILDPLGIFDESESSKLSREQWEWQKEKYEENYSDQQDWAWRNYNTQVGELEYQRNLNALQMEREDDAVQRRVADLKASGLSPTLAAGSAAQSAAMHAGSFSSVNAPQREVGDNPQVQAAMFKEQMEKERLGLLMTLAGNIADISRTKAETEFINAQKDRYLSETPIDLKLKELDQVLKETTLENEIKIKAQQVDLNELRKINDELSLKVMENEIALRAYNLQIKEIEAKYSEREHKAGVEKTEAEKDKLVEEVKEKAIAVEMAEFLRDKVKEAGVPLEMMSPAFKNLYSFKLYGTKVADEPGPNGVPFKDTKAGNFLKKIFVKSPGLKALKAAALSNN